MFVQNIYWMYLIELSASMYVTPSTASHTYQRPSSLHLAEKSSKASLVHIFQPYPLNYVVTFSIYFFACFLFRFLLPYFRAKRPTRPRIHQQWIKSHKYYGNNTKTFGHSITLVGPTAGLSPSFFWCKTIKSHMLKRLDKSAQTTTHSWLLFFRCPLCVALPWLNSASRKTIVRKWARQTGRDVCAAEMGLNLENYAHSCVGTRMNARAVYVVECVPWKRNGRFWIGWNGRIEARKITFT